MNLDSINWLQAVANLVLCLGGVGGFGLWYKSYIVEAVQLTFNGQLVMREEYRKDRDAMWQEINQIKKFDAEFQVLKTKMTYVQDDVTEMKADIKGLDKSITGAIMRAAGMRNEQ